MGVKFVSQINTSRAQVLGFRPICFVHRMEKEKLGKKKWKLTQKTVCFRVVSSSLGP